MRHAANSCTRCGNPAPVVEHDGERKQCKCGTCGNKFWLDDPPEPEKPKGQKAGRIEIHGYRWGELNEGRRGARGSE